MKLRKWLSLLLVMALAFTMLSQSGVTVSATELSDTSEATEDTDDSVQTSSETDASDQEQQDSQEADLDAEQQTPEDAGNPADNSENGNAEEADKNAENADADKNPVNPDAAETEKDPESPSAGETAQDPENPDDAGTEQPPEIPDTDETKQDPETSDTDETKQDPETPDAAETEQLPENPDAAGTMEQNPENSNPEGAEKTPESPDAAGTTEHDPENPDAAAPEQPAEEQVPDDEVTEDGTTVYSLFPLKEVYVSLYLNGYSDQQLKTMKVTELVKLLEENTDREGNAIVIPDDAEILCGFQRSDEGYVMDRDEFHPLDRKGTIDMSSPNSDEDDMNYTMQLIVGTNNQLDADNIRYIVNVYINLIEEDLDYYVYAKETEGSSYRQKISSKKIQSKESSLLGDIRIPVTEVSYYPEDDSPYQAGSTCYLGIRSGIANNEKRNIDVNIYPMQNYLNYQKGGTLEGAITDQILVDYSSSLSQEGGYEADYSSPDSANPLVAKNVFCIVYSDAYNGKVIAARGLIFVISSDAPKTVKGKVYAYQDGQMKEAAKLTYSGADNRNDNAIWGVDQKGEVVVKYNSYWNDFTVQSEYSEEDDFYYVMDADSRIDKVVRGSYNSWQEAAEDKAEDVTGQVLPGNTSVKPYGYEIKGSRSFTVFYKDGLVLKVHVDLIFPSQQENTDVSFYVQGAVAHEDDVFRVDTSLDSYYRNGYQTLFINDTDVDLKNLIPIFHCNDNVRVYVGTEQKSGESVQDFSNGPVLYNAFINDNPRNYQVSFIKKENSPKLYVNGPDEREVFLTESYNYRQHDILIANVGTEALTGLKVELLNATHVKLDDYWTVGGENNDMLGAFTTVNGKDLNGNHVSYGELFNLAKIRLQPDGEGEITGTLKVSADGQEDVLIKLRGFAGNPKITTESLGEGVKYVPYSYVVATNSMYDWNKVTFSIESGELPEGVTMDEKTGEIYGVPKVAGEFPITVMASFSRSEFVPSYANFTLKINENTDDNVYGASDPGYEIEEHVGTQVSDTEFSVYHYVLTQRDDQLFVSTGVLGEFQDLWLNGEKLVDGVDYSKESGSTRITIRRQTFENKANQTGSNTLAAEFRVDGKRENELKRTAQNFNIDFREGGGSKKRGSSDNDADGGSSGSGAGTAVSATQATLVMRMVDTAGNPLPNMTVELHSTPKVTQSNANGIAIFGGVDSGAHTLYAKDAAGNVIASRGFELVFGDRTQIIGDQLTVKAGAASTIGVQLVGNELKFLSLQAGDVYRVLPAGTNDTSNAGAWLLLVMLSGCMLFGAGLYWKRKR